MSGVLRWVSRAMFVMCAGVWAWLMVVAGVMVVIDFPVMFPDLVARSYGWLALGAALAAFGCVLLGVVAGRALPKAHPVATTLYQRGPLVALAIVLIGGLL